MEGTLLTGSPLIYSLVKEIKTMARSKGTQRVDPIIIEDAKIIWKNFAGEEKQNNREGDRNFCVRIDDPEFAQVLAGDGWNIKHYTPRDGYDGDEFDYLQVAVKYEKYPPEIIMVTKRNKVVMTESNVGILDSKRFTAADIIITPSYWEVNGKTGIKAYVQTMYVVVEENPFAAKYERFNGGGDDLPFDTQ